MQINFNAQEDLSLEDWAASLAWFGQWEPSMYGDSTYDVTFPTEAEKQPYYEGQAELLKLGARLIFWVREQGTFTGTEGMWLLPDRTWFNDEYDEVQNGLVVRNFMLNN